MLRILGSKRRLCDGLTRRDWLNIGGLGFLGVGLSDVLRLKDARAKKSDASNLPAGPFGKAKSVILLLPYGSPPQHETFDPKPEAPAEVRGEMGAIPTNVPGVSVCDHLPRIARIMDRLTVIRSMTHPFPVHGTAYAVSGIPEYTPALETRPKDPKHWPFIGSVVDYVEERRDPSAQPPVPRNVALPWKMNSRGGPVASGVVAGPYAAFLGPAYDPVLTEFEGEGSREIYKLSRDGSKKYILKDPYAGIQPDGRFYLAGTELREGLTLDRQNRRRNLLGQLDDVRKQLDQSSETNTFDRYQRLAFTLLTSSRVQQALNIQKEPRPLREAYGMTLFGQSCIAARRLVEAGSKFVTVFWDEYAYLNSDWDTHWNHYYRLKDRLLPGFDMAFPALITDLEQRGLLDETLVVWMSEHGRTPKMNKAVGGGRDHWSRVYSIALAGGGIGRGQVIGSSDRLGGDVDTHPVSPKDILATIFYSLGIDPHSTVPNRLGQPLPLAGTGVVRPELYG